jgi:hypothetical protein
MSRVACSACNKDIEPNPPERGYWVLIVTFWIFSLLFGIGAALGSGWGLMLLLAWVLLASTTGMLVQRVTVWTCSDCGATVRPPAQAARRADEGVTSAAHA